MIEFTIDWEIVKTIVVYGSAIAAIYFAGSILTTRKIMRQISIALGEYEEAFDAVADALEDDVVSEEEYERMFKEFQEGYGESVILFNMIKEAIPYKFLTKFFVRV